MVNANGCLIDTDTQMADKISNNNKKSLSVLFQGNSNEKHKVMSRERHLSNIK